MSTNLAFPFWGKKTTMNSGSSCNSFEMMNVFYFSGIKITWCTGWGAVGGGGGLQ